MSAQPSFEKASWTSPSDVLEAVRRHAPRGKVSAYVADAVLTADPDDLRLLTEGHHVRVIGMGQGRAPQTPA